VVGGVSQAYVDAGDDAVIRGTVTRTIPEWPCVASNTIDSLVIRGDSLRAAYMDGYHNYVGVEGDIVFSGTVGTAPQVFHELHVIYAGVTGAIRYEGGNNYTWGHLFLERAQVHAVTCTNGWPGVTLFAHNWSGGHVGGGPAGSGLGPLVGRVLPYNLQNLLVSDGMRLTGMGATLNCVWHNVLFEPGQV